MSNRLTVCALVPTYNRACYLGECLDSLIAQTRALDQIIVINDGSTDDTRTIVHSYGDRVMLLDKENGGKSSALNLGMQFCSSDLVWICDDDDLAIPDGLELLAKRLEEDPSIDLVFGQMRPFKVRDGRKIYSRSPKFVRAEEPSIKINCLERFVAPQFATLVRKSHYDKVGPFSEHLIRSQDLDMAIRLTRWGKAVAVRDVIYCYREHDGVRGSASTPISSLKIQEKWIFYDRLIIGNVGHEYALDEFTPTFACGWRPSLLRRATLLQRGCVFLRPGLWTDVIDAMSAALEADFAPLTLEERRLIEATSPDSLFVWRALYESPEDIERLRGLYIAGRNGRYLVFELFSYIGFLCIRQIILYRDYSTSKEMFILLTRVLGFTGACRRILNSLASKLLVKFNRTKSLVSQQS